ncbi:MAG: Putative Fe-only hydrogenase [candidate division WS6 bacterium 34_10]|uniref:Putative Fe-only hydrogenase n=1 Tax=candidate division WS6 bacterium 34_10 TaxID=1641389 RepID=A0A101HFV4_9BACT|nr:MAG: Putative Fe-only hydrogenase [candidate division WS6 bacterium 34_10]
MEEIQIKKLTFLENKYLQISLLYILAFSIPFLLRGPQLLVGSLVNFLFILAISQYKFKEIAPALLLPSIASYSYGLLFGGATNFLLYLIPVITIANAIYVLSFKQIETKYVNVLIAGALKALFLFGCTYLLVKTIGLPELFLTAMGITQFITACVGGLFASVVINIPNKK